MAISPSTLLLVGCGNMGGALLSRWKEILPAGISDFHVIDPKSENALSSLSELPLTEIPDVIIFAVKPQSLSEILPEYKNRFGAKPLYVSIAAGKTISFFEKYLGDDAKIIRAMPNTPALVGKAITGLCANKNISDADKSVATELLIAVGKTVWVDEEKMDAVTAISGSGPAYMLLFLDALTKAGEKIGLPPEQAKLLAMETVHGTIHLAAKSSESYEQLRKNVTSPGGTTEAALAVLMNGNALENLVEEAVQKARKRAAELSQ